MTRDGKTTIQDVEGEVTFEPQGGLKELEVTYEKKAQLGRPVDPNSTRQKRLKSAPGKRTGRPIDPNSARQKRLAEMEQRKKENGGVVKRGRPVNPNSERQKAIAERQARIEAGETIKRGRPVGSGVKNEENTEAPEAKATKAKAKDNKKASKKK